jgi:hypothetical protein
MNITATAQAATIVTAAASVGYYYDIVPADVIEADTDHMIASATVFTVP